jgi:outer membrane protein OmpA-like peptidoglycan-associated protein
MRALQLYAVLITLITACSHEKPEVVTKPVPPVRQAAAPAKPAETTPTPISPSVSVSDDLLRRCRLQLQDMKNAPKFDYDQFELLPADRDVLDQIARCLTSGPLRGQALRLTGRADPRGSQEYNLALGTRRAGTVAGYLERLGVPTAQLVRATRGDLDAIGTDEGSWQMDRRVDLELVQ